MHIIVRRTEREFREAADRAGLSRAQYSGLARSEEEAHELTKRRGDQPGKALAFDDGGQADRELMRTAGIPEEHIARREWDKQRSRK